MSDITEFTSNLYFTKSSAGAFRFYVNSGSATGLAALDYDTNDTTNYFIINSELKTISIPSGTTFTANNLVTEYLTVGSLTGNTGPRGLQGSQGLFGLQGLDGDQGFVGFQSNIGSQGNQGNIGNIGSQGAIGITISGLQGIQGLQGNQGLQGVQGLSITGFIGLQGFQGLQGIQSLDGSQGVQGNTGNQGSQGWQGVRGLQGNQGFQSAIGRQGFFGPQGIQGSQNVQSFQGWQGGNSAGNQGFQGVQGSAFNPATSFSNYNILLSDGSNTGARSQTGLSYTGGIFRVVGNNLSITGDCNVSGLLRTYIANTDNSGGYISTTVGTTQIKDYPLGFGKYAFGSYSTKISGSISSDQGRGIAVDTTGNSYVTGYYWQPATVYNSDGSAFATLSGSVGFDVFVVKYGTAGMASWVTRISGTNIDQGNAIAVDTSGNSYVTGLSNSGATVYNSDGTAFVTLSGSGNTEAFVVKYGTTGMGSWATRISGTSVDQGFGIAVDTTGNSYVTGQYFSLATVYNSDGTAFVTLAGSGSSEAFVVKYGTTGMGEWTTRISGTLADVGYGIAVDGLGNSYVTGSYTQTGTVYNSDGTTFLTLSGSGSTEAFVVKYGTTGMGSWATQISGTLADVGYGIAVDTSGNSYVTGSYNQPATVYNSDGSAFITLAGSGSTEAFLVKYGITGMGSWATRISGTSDDIGYGIAVDTSGNSYVTGSYTQPATVYNSDGTAFTTLSGDGNTDGFIIKYGTTGMGIWSTRIGGTLNDSSQGIAIDTNGNTYITGYYRQPAIVYNSDGTTFTTLSGSGNDEAFVVKYNQEKIYYLSDLTDVTSNYGKTVTVFNTTPNVPQTVNLINSSNAIYDTATVTYSKQFVFYNSRWNVVL